MALEPKSIGAGDEDDSELRDMTRRMGISAVLTVPVFLLAMLPMLGVNVERLVSVTAQAWIASHGGRRRPAVLSSGFKYKPIAIRPDESQFLETRKFQRGEIGMMFGIPPHMIGNTDTTSNWGTGIEQQSMQRYLYRLFGTVTNKNQRY